MTQSWQFWIDVGGTFTDCIGIAPDGQLHQHKTLSSGIVRGTIGAVEDQQRFTDTARTTDPSEFWNGAVIRIPATLRAGPQESVVGRFSAASGRFSLCDPLDLQPGQRYELDPGCPAPVTGIRWILRLNSGAPIPAADVRFGTTRGTNALLTRSGARTALITTRGFADVPAIGNQDRPRLFDLNIRKPTLLCERVLEVDERVAADGQILRVLDEASARAGLRMLQREGIESLAICLLHGWIEPRHERRLHDLAREAGFSEVSYSFEVAPQIGLVPRCDTTILDAYLNPVLRRYLAKIESQLAGSRVLVMTSAGGLVDCSEFRGRDAILSGPAGGIVGFSRVAVNAGFQQAIGFDMGGTSTDVARYGGRFEYDREATKAGVRILTPLLAIETVAAGGGSVCAFDGTRLRVGPDSAGADPGPACYGAGGPLTVTDLNVYLGRILPGHFPLPLDRPAVVDRLKALQQQMQDAGVWGSETSLPTLAEGLLQLANDNMVQAIRRVSVAKGFDPADHVLVSFGGAGGQHACAVARQLGMSRVLLHPLAGILSAWGMGQAELKQRRTVSVLRPLEDDVLTALQSQIQQLGADATAQLQRQGVPAGLLSDPHVEFDLRYAGTDSAIAVTRGTRRDCVRRFEQEYQRQFGYTREDRGIEIAAVSVEVTGRAAARHEPPTATRNSVPVAADGRTEVFFAGQSHKAAVYLRASLQSGWTLPGPAIVCEPTSTILIEPDCIANVMPDGSIQIEVGMERQAPPADALASAADPILLEIFNNQFVSIAEQMGETLRRTSVSTNVRDRLDYSCALFDSQGRLVVNAPHVPVHLGAMGETVRAVMHDHPWMEPGDVFVTNDPFRGGSHLPDVTVVTPVFAGEPQPSFYVANRAHHAEIGGVAPGSMPPFSTTLAEEGVLICSRHLVCAGQPQEQALRELLLTGQYPSRSVDDNLADLTAQAAANACGVRLLTQLCHTRSAAVVQQYMLAMQRAAERKMRDALRQLEDGAHTFADQLDDGSEVCVSILVQGTRATVDFSGTACVHPGNLNANRAITTAAVLYVFRCLINEDVPLNAGVLAPLEIILPAGLLNPPAATTAADSPAMVGGNVETSQRIVDVLLGALQLAAASQGTMNNLTFGNQTFGYYETIGGGAGATSLADGADAVHTHMTNTRLTDPEILEHRYPVRLRCFEIRRGSGGVGHRDGGDGLVREIEILSDLQVSMLSQRRTNGPWGVQGGGAGLPGRNSLLAGSAGPRVDLGGAFTRRFVAGEILRIETPGGGGWQSRDTGELI